MNNDQQPAGLILLLIACLVFLSLFAGLVECGQAETKNYYFPELRAEIHVQEDGSFTVEEDLTFEFQGQFSWAAIWIPMRARKNSELKAKIMDFRVRDEKNQDLPLETIGEKEKFQAKWRFSAGNERRTFHITYRVKNGILSYPEVSELYWQIIGSEVDKPTGRAEVIVHLPQPVASREDLLIYGHGPLSGSSEILDLKTFRFLATGIASGQFMEIRVIWPAGLLVGLPASGQTRETIELEEALYVRETLEKVRQARESEARRVGFLKRLGLAWVIWQIIGPVLWLLVYFYYWKRIGKDYHFEDIPEYFREIPSDLPPALVQVLRKEGGKALPVSFTATIFDLATRGFLVIEDEPIEKKSLFSSRIRRQTVFNLRKPYHQDHSLRDWEKDVLSFVFDSYSGRERNPGSRVILDELVNHIKKHPSEYQAWFRSWQKKIDREAREIGFIEPESRKAYKIFLVASLILASLTLSPVMFVLALAVSPNLRRRRKDWARENEFWKALDRFLDDFSDFKETPAEAYKLWDRYLVFAILFGSAKKLSKILPEILQDEQASAPAWIGGGLAVGGLGRQINSIASAISSIEKAASALSQASASAANYSSGGGGGFSSGGGRGGGGGGVSAG